LSEALACCDRAIAADRLNSAGHYLRSMILLESSRPNEALVSLRRTLYLDPDFALAHYTLGDLTRRHGRERETGKHWQNALALLRDRPPDEPLREAEGLTAGRLAEIIQQQTAFIGRRSIFEKQP
jgi:chemotaxis protein methyltransferase CheR